MAGSLFGAISVSLTSLRAQSQAVNIISNNIANLSTTGFKGTNVSFATLIAGEIGGGVLNSLRTNVTEQGSVNATSINSDLAVQGNGFFTVKDASGNLRYTRAGSFRTDSGGNLVNEAGYILYGWPLDTQGRLPGELGNLNTTSSTEITSLVPISKSAITGTPSPTTSLAAKMNLSAEQATLSGAGNSLELQSAVNTSSSSNSAMILPSGFAVGSTLVVANPDSSTTFTYGGIANATDLFTANAGAGVAGATTASATFTGWTNGDSILIQSGSMSAAVEFTYNSSADGTDPTVFKNLQQLSAGIEATTGLRSRIGGTNNATMYVSAEDANDSVTFTAGATGTIRADLVLTTNVASGTNRFASLSDLSERVNDVSSLTATSDAVGSLDINNIDPTDTITFSGTAGLLTELGITASTVAKAYDPTVSGSNMASGGVPSAFSSVITIFDSQGKALDLRLAFTKLTSTSVQDSWGVELYASDPTAVENTGNADGLLSYGTITFDGDGNLTAVGSPLNGTITIDPTGVATAQPITLNLGTIGTAEGLSEYSGDSSVDTFTQDGFPTGKLQSLQIDSQGIVTAVFDNSLTSQVYRLPLAFFPNGDGLTAESGNAYSSNTTAGEVKLRKVGDAGVGSIIPGALETSTADIGEELTKLVVSQQAYSASANVLRKVNDLFDELKNI